MAADQNAAGRSPSPDPAAVAEAARAWQRAGCSVLPVDKGKRPAVDWQSGQRTAAGPEQIGKWFNNGHRHDGLALVTGHGNLECLEFEYADVWDDYAEAAKATGLGDLLDRVVTGYWERSPGGGVHLLYRCSAVAGSTKLARKEKTVLIETRGRYAVVVVAPSGGKVHPSGEPYELLAGGPETLAEITPEERAALFDLARTFDCQPPPPPRPEARRRFVGGTRPGDNFNRRASWPDVLDPADWTSVLTRRDDETYWRRPGKTEGWSATTNHAGSDLLWVFSTSAAPFEAERSYDKFGAYTALHHGGDFAAAARALADQGYDEAEGHELFRRYSAPELAAEPPPFEWIAKGLVVRPTYGVIAGEKKSLKTYVALAVAVAVAAGVPVLGHFRTREPRPVVIYVGEGGRVPFQRRLQRVARAYGVNLADLPIYVSFETAPLDRPRFLDTLRRDIEELDPGLVIVDPLYAFHSSKVNASNLYERGAMLNAASSVAADASVSLLIIDHFNKGGSGTGLERISQAGMGEWADTWILLSHAKAPSLDAGEFQLLMEVGSRQWGGRTYSLTILLGAFDEETGEHSGEIEWAVIAESGNAADIREQAKSGAREARATNDILRVLEDKPFELVQTDVVKEAGGKKETTRAAFDALDAAGTILSERVPGRDAKGRKISRQVWGLNPDPPRIGPGRDARSRSSDGAGPP